MAEAHLARVRQLLRIPSDAPLATDHVETLEGLRQLRLLPPASIIAYVESLSEAQHVVLWFSLLLYDERFLKSLLEDWDRRPMVEGSDPRRDLHLFVSQIWSGQYSVTLDDQALFLFSKYPSLCIPKRMMTDSIAIACMAVSIRRRLFNHYGSTSRGKSALLTEFRYNALLPRIVDRGRITALYLHGFYTKRPKSKPDMIAALQRVCAELETSRSPLLAELSNIQRAVSAPAFTNAHLGPFVYPAAAASSQKKSAE